MIVTQFIGGETELPLSVPQDFCLVTDGGLSGVRMLEWTGTDIDLVNHTAVAMATGPACCWIGGSDMAVKVSQIQTYRWTGASWIAVGFASGGIQGNAPAMDMISNNIILLASQTNLRALFWNGTSWTLTADGIFNHLGGNYVGVAAQEDDIFVIANPATDSLERYQRTGAGFTLLSSTPVGFALVNCKLCRLNASGNNPAIVLFNNVGVAGVGLSVWQWNGAAYILLSAGIGFGSAGAFGSWGLGLLRKNLIGLARNGGAGDVVFAIHWNGVSLSTVGNGYAGITIGNIDLAGFI